MQREEGSDGVDGSRDEIDGAKMIVDSVVTYTMLGMRKICPEDCDHELRDPLDFHAYSTVNHTVLCRMSENHANFPKLI